MKSKAVLIFVASCLLLSLASANKPDKLDLESLCSEKHIELTKRSHVGALVKQLKSEPKNSCPDHVRLALVELDQLINDSDSIDVCSLEHVEEIKVFYEKHIAQSLANTHNNEVDKSKQLPATLQHFFLGYGLKVSSLCKKNMINSLQYESRRLLRPEDFDGINLWTDEKSGISQVMNEPADYDDLLLPRDIERVLRDMETNPEDTDESPADDKILLQTATGHIIKRIQAVCERRFKPIYEQLILPLIYLSNLGFNYQGEDLEREMKEMSVNKEIHQWYRIVYLCESLYSLEIVEDPNDSEKTEGSDRRLVRILSREEAARLKDEEKDSAPKAQDEHKLERVVFKPEYGNVLENEVIDLNDKNFLELLHAFATHKNELDRIRAKLLKKMSGFLFKMLKGGQFKIIGSLMGSKKESGNEDVIKLVDDYVDQASSGEAPVAGPSKVGGYARRMYHQAAYSGVSGIAFKVKKNTWDKAKVGKWFHFALSAVVFIIACVMLSGR